MNSYRGFPDRAEQLSPYSGMQALSPIFCHDLGLHTLYRGLASTICREAVFGAIYTFSRRWGTPSNSSSTTGSSVSRLEKTSAAPSLSTPSSASPTLSFSHPFTQNFLAASLAVIVSSPFNYVRNMQLAAPLNKPTPSSSAILRSLWREAFGCVKTTRGPYDSELQHGATTPWFINPSLKAGRGHYSKTAPASPSHVAKVKISQLLSRHPRVLGGFIVADRLRVGWGTLRASFGMSVGAVLYDYCMGRAG